MSRAPDAIQTPASVQQARRAGSRTAHAVTALLLGILALDPAPAGAAESRPVRVAFRAGHLSLEAMEQPWAKIVDEIARETGVAIRVLPGLEGAATVSFEDLPVERALRRLFGPDVGLVFRYDAAGSLAPPTQVWVVGARSSVQAAAIAGAHPPQRPAVVAEDPWEEIEALSRQEARGIVPVLLAGLSDPDPFVRKQAEDLLCRLRSDSTLSVNGQSLLGDTPSPEREELSRFIGRRTCVARGRATRSGL